MGWTMTCLQTGWSRRRYPGPSPCGRHLAAVAAAAIVLAIPAGTGAQEPDSQLNALMERLRTNWESLDGLTARFTHTFEWVLAGETQVTRGRLWIAGRTRFRLELEGRVMVSDGDTIWDWDQEQNQVLIFNADPERGISNQQQLFLAYTEGVDVEGLSEETVDGTLYVSVRIHRQAWEDPSSVDIVIDTDRLLAVRADYADGAGNTHAYVLDDIRTGPQEETHFTFSIPAGVTVVDMRPPGD